MALKQQKGLGRGLDAIFDSEQIVPAPNSEHRQSSVGELDITLVSRNPQQPRTEFDQDTLAELADSIRALGVIQPITVMPTEGDRYIIISGERRWRAAQMAGLRTIPAYVRDATDDQALHEMALVENIQRQDLGPLEIAISLGRLMDEFSLTQDKLSERVGKKRSTIANYLRLLELPAEVQVALKEGMISMGHAKAIASADKDAQLAVLKKIVSKGLSVRKAEELVAVGLDKANVGKTQTAEEDFPESYARLVELLEGIFSDNITIKGGKIIIGFNGEDDIKRFIKKLS